MSRLPESADHLDPTVLLLKRLFATVSAPLLASTLVACDTGAQERIVPHQRTSALASGPTCDGAKWIPTSSLSLPHDVDFVSLRRRSSGAPDILSESGKPCEKAKDPRLCQAEIDRVSVRDILSDGSSYLLTTSGDTVRAFQTFAEKLALLGEIDTPDEALLIALHEGYLINCESTVIASTGGFRIFTSNDSECIGKAQRFELLVDPQGELTQVKVEDLPDPGCAVLGRRPPGLCTTSPRERARSRLARYFANAAHLEAAAVDAFEIMDREFSQHHLPRTLREAVRNAAEDETRHARDTTRLAERYGARARKPAVSRTPLRTLSEIALDNAVEGCVLETYAAYIATLQAAYARDPELKRVLTTIAEDETRHAALSWQLAAFAEPRLDARTRRVIQARRLSAIATLGMRRVG